MDIQQTQLLMKALSFAADKHRFQRRKDVAGTPYINHPINVALTLMEIGEEHNTDLLVAAVLHDTIEDTETTASEIETHFGKDALAIVLEVTDDKSLSASERKRLQVVHASRKSLSARKLKLADKICNVSDIIHHPPGNWTVERKLLYLDWAAEVLYELKGSNLKLEAHLASLISEGRNLFQLETNTHH
jgi:GTP diphosphokinase / guanosine-3',5'-bis(diphosphate) 3'-diphosphatase